MDCTSNDSADELQRNPSSSINNSININNANVVELVNNATTSGTSSSDVKQRDAEKEEEKCLEDSPTMMIVKGKRTKRQRLHSPIINVEHKCSNNQEDEVRVEDEELDIANCLILLARGQSKPPPPLIRSTMRFSSENKRPCYNNASVYECKTCNRTFTSFQALGGHRASHKKLKVTATAENDHRSSSPLVTVALQLGNISYSRAFNAQNNNSIKSNIHECSICGAEFSSGQALGGHMRRHRGLVMPLNSTTNKPPFDNTTLSLSTTAPNADGFLSLDLNLPASLSPPPQDHHHHDTKQQQQQPQSSSALVDCFY